MLPGSLDVGYKEIEIGGANEVNIQPACNANISLTYFSVSG